MDFIGAII